MRRLSSAAPTLTGIADATLLDLLDTARRRFRRKAVDEPARKKK